MKKVKLNEVVKDLTEERKIIISDQDEVVEPTITSKTHKISPRKIIKREVLLEGE